MAVRKTPNVVPLDSEPVQQRNENADWSAETTDGWSETTESVPFGAPVLEEKKKKKKASATDPAQRFHQGATTPALPVVVDDPNRTAPDEE